MAGLGEEGERPLRTQQAQRDPSGTHNGLTKFAHKKQKSCAISTVLSGTWGRLRLIIGDQ